MIEMRLQCDTCGFDVPESDEGLADAAIHNDATRGEHHVSLNEVIGDRWDSVRGYITPTVILGVQWFEFELTVVTAAGARIGQHVMVEKKRLDRYGMRIFDRVLMHMIRDLDRHGPIR